MLMVVRSSYGGEGENKNGEITDHVGVRPDRKLMNEGKVD